MPFRLQGAGGLNNSFVELQNVYPGHKLRVGVKSDAKPAFVPSAGVKQFIGEFHYRNLDDIRRLANILLY